MEKLEVQHDDLQGIFILGGLWILAILSVVVFCKTLLKG